MRADRPVAIPGGVKQSCRRSLALLVACALAAAATRALVFPAEAAGPPKSLKVCVQTRGSRENVGDLNSRGTLCGRGARLRLPIEPVIGKRRPVGPPGPKGDRGPVGESAPHGWID